MKSKHGLISNCSKYLKKLNKSSVISTFDDKNLSIDAIWVLLISESLMVWRSV